VSGENILPYLIWSHEHGRWWLRRHGYTPHLSEAARFTREQAIDICAKAITGTASRLRALPDLPVRLTDVEAMVTHYKTVHPIFPPEEWE
jgi:hypothetical protein